MEVLVDRYVRVIDELQEVIKEMKTQPLNLRVASALKALPPCSSSWQREAAREEAVDAVMTRYRAEVEEPAFAILRERKASGGSRMRKEPVTFSIGYDNDYYAEVLDGIDLRLPDELPAPPGVAPLTFAISWPPDHHLRRYPMSGFISSWHDGYLAVHFGNFVSGCPTTGCYLVINTRANSIAIVRPLPPGCFAPKSHGSIGSGVGILHHSEHGLYILVELYCRREDDGHGFSNKATLFMWRSAGSGALADQWTDKEVVLPLPFPAHRDIRSFRANMVLAVGTAALCWVDLWTGILVADGSADDDLVFHYIPLPEECTIEADPLLGRREPEHSRSMSVVDPQHMVFVYIDEKAMLTTWTLSSPLTQDWFWEKGPSLRILDLLGRLPIAKGDPKLQQLTARCPVISRKQPDVVHFFVVEFEYKDEHDKHDKWEVQGYYEFSANIQNGLILSFFEFPPGNQPFRHARIFTTDMGYLPEKKMMGEEVFDEGESNISSRLRRQHLHNRGIPIPYPPPIGVSSGGKKIPVGLQCVLDYGDK